MNGAAPFPVMRLHVDDPDLTARPFCVVFSQPKCQHVHIRDLREHRYACVLEWVPGQRATEEEMLPVIRGVIAIGGFYIASFVTLWEALYFMDPAGALSRPKAS